jgi:hypothetical protein
MRQSALDYVARVAALPAGEGNLDAVRTREAAVLAMPFGPRLRSTVLQTAADYEAR